MALVLSRSLSTASLASLPSSSSFLLRNSNRNRVLNLTTAFVPQNGLRKRFSSSGLKWKYERRNHQFALWCKAAAVAEKEAADTSSEKFEYQAEVRLFSIFPFNFVYPLLKKKKKKKDWFPQPICYMFYTNNALQGTTTNISNLLLNISIALEKLACDIQSYPILSCTSQAFIASFNTTIAQKYPWSPIDNFSPKKQKRLSIIKALKRKHCDMLWVH